MNIPFLKPPFENAERRAVMEVMRTNQLTVGPQVPQFEEAFAEYIGTEHAVAINSGTSSLEIALKSLIMTGKLVKEDAIIIAEDWKDKVNNNMINMDQKYLYLIIIKPFLDTFFSFLVTWRRL